MYGLDNNSGISVMPDIAPTTSPVPLWFTEGGANQSPSYPGQDWYNMIQAELLSVLLAAGITPDKANPAQLAAAIKAIISAGSLMIKNSLSEIKAAGPISVAAAISNLGLSDIVKAGTAIGNLSGAIVKFPLLNGTTKETLIVQWVVIPGLVAGGSSLINYPTPFPETMLAVATVAGATGAGMPGFNVQSIDKNSLRVWNQSTTQGSGIGILIALGK